MGLEIEHKFLVKDSSWVAHAQTPRSLKQAYLSDDGKLVIRVRIDSDNNAVLTIKSAQSGNVRQEFEYDIPIDEAVELLTMGSGNVIEKKRYTIPMGNLIWEIDVFEGENQGLVIAEIELDHEGQKFDRPSWLGEEVTEEKRYYNSSLSQHPFTHWND